MLPFSTTKNKSPMVPGLVFGTESIKAKQKPLPFLLNKRAKADCKDRLDASSSPSCSSWRRCSRRDRWRGRRKKWPRPGLHPAPLLPRNNYSPASGVSSSGLWASGAPAVSLGNSHNMACEFLSLLHEPRREAF